MTKLIIFFILSVPIVIISWRSLLKFNSHGFFRFFSWECILWLMVSNIKMWFVDSFSIHQVISWILLIVSLYVVLAGVMLMKKIGKPQDSRKDSSLYAFEKTSELVQQGIFKYIRHPLYSSLLYLTWGIYFKQPLPGLLLVSIASSVFLFLTAWFEEKEDIAYFGDEYREYRRKSKMFIPFIL
jgi:protein-S-isoprenylcysteine O-methyltransferase Ste14